MMRSKIQFISIVLCLVFTAVNAQKYNSKSTSEVKTVYKGVSFYSTKTISDNTKEMSEFSFLNKVLEDKKLAQSLADEEMVTVFLPTNAYFNSLEKSEREVLLANSTIMSNTIKFLSVPGRLDFASIKRAIELNNGTAYFGTLLGEKLGAKLVDGKVVLFDSKNNIATITATDFYHKNGFFHIIDGLVFPSANED